MSKLIFYAVGIFLLSAACNSGSSGKDETQSDPTMGHQDMLSNNSQNMDIDSDVKSITVPRSNTASAVLDAYLDIKNALAADDQSAAAEAGSQLEKQAAAMDVNDIDDPSQMKEVKEILDVVKEHGEHIAESKIEHQREHFAMLEKDLKDLIKVVGTDRPLYEQYCPMYDNNKGGSWLSTSDQIQNPLLGSKMPRCGEVQQVITMQ